MSEYIPEPKYFRGKVEIELNLSDYALIIQQKQI